MPLQSLQFRRFEMTLLSWSSINNVNHFYHREAQYDIVRPRAYYEDGQYGEDNGVVRMLLHGF